MTIEGLGSVKKMHDTQKAVSNQNGSQCGFCTPGIVISLFAELVNNPRPTEKDIEDAFDGNLCRCTGYRPILDGAKKMACRKECSSCLHASSCENPIRDIEEINYPSPDPERKPLFPSVLQEYYVSMTQAESYVFEKNSYKWAHPGTVEELLNIVNNFPSSKIIHGNTEVGIEMRFKNQNYPVLISVSDIAELKTTLVLDTGIEFGSATTLSSLQNQLFGFISIRKGHETSGLQALFDNLKYFAGKQIRNVSSIAGNICTASPISDLNPVFVAIGAILTVMSKTGGRRKIPMSEFFLGFSKFIFQVIAK